MKFLYAAYAATWLIHITYVALLSRRYRLLRDEMHDLHKK